MQPIFHHEEAITSGCIPPTNQALKGNYQLPRRQHSDEVCGVEQSQTIVSLRHNVDLHSFSILNTQYFHSVSRVVSRVYIKFAESDLDDDDDDKKCTSTHKRSNERREQSRNEKREVFRPAVRREEK